MHSPGDLISNYRLVRELGAGGFGEVWEAEHLDLGVRVAIKLPKMAEYIRQLRSEGRNQHGVNHPNVVQVRDLNTAHHPPFCVMELVEGEDLRRLLLRRGKLSQQEVLDIARQVLSALVAAHGQGILHRDVKPENILLSTAGTVKVADFGLGSAVSDLTRSILRSESNNASIAKEESSGLLRSDTGEIVRSDDAPTGIPRGIVGTFEYMSPEQQRGDAVDARADVYSVAVIMVELLTGRRPSGDADGMLRREGVDGYIIEALLVGLDEVDFRHRTALSFLHSLRLEPIPATSSDGQGVRTVFVASSQSVRELVSSIHSRMKRLDGGVFQMGSDDGPENERPRHPREVAPYRLCIHAAAARELCTWLNEVSDDNQMFVRNGGQSTIVRVGSVWKPQHGCEWHPANFVTWVGAQAFCTWLSEVAGQRYRLPTEAEWEFAATSGGRCRPFPWGSGAPSNARCRFGQAWQGAAATFADVRDYPPSDFGMHQMAGNVWEWCQDTFEGDYARAHLQAIDTDPGHDQGRFHVVRGGCWSSNADELVVTRRTIQLRGTASGLIGLRLAMDDA